MAEVKNLTVRYGKNAVLKDFSAEFPSGKVTAISGRSGCGKTTLLSVVAGLLRPSHGVCSGFGTCSVLFQEDRLLPFLTAAKNLTVTTGCTESEANAALQQVGFHAEDNGKIASALSGGMARRVAIVRAILAESDTLILDEPFKGLDDKTRTEVLAFVNTNRRGRTTLVVTHDPRDAEDLHAEYLIHM